MPTITAPAVRIEQDDKVLYLTRFTVAELASPGFYQVRELVVGEEKSGFQRALEERRAQQFAKYIDDVEEQTFLPTSLFLATAGKMAYDTATGEIKIETSGDKKRPFFYMVDGQHRAAGLQRAANRLENDWLRNFPVPAVIATELDFNNQMVQFLIVNTTQKKVSADIEQEILAQFMQEEGVADMPNLPGIITKKMGTVDKAVSLAKHLNSSFSSPWQGKIRKPNSLKGDTTANQKAVVNSLKEFVLIRTHPVAMEDDSAKRGKMLENYWTAVVGEFAPRDNDDMNIPLLKTPGMHIFHYASMSVFKHLVRNGLPFTVQNFRDCFVTASAHIDDDHDALFSPHFWKRSGLVSGFNRGTSLGYAKALSNAVDSMPRHDQKQEK